MFRANRPKLWYNFHLVRPVCIIVAFAFATATAAPNALPPALARLPRPQGAILALQICLDRRGLSVNAFDGQYGRKTAAAVEAWCERTGRRLPPSGFEEHFWNAYFPGETNLLREVEVTADDLASLVKIPTRPADKAALPVFGFETLQEKFAEIGHLSETTLKRLNPNLAWPNPPAGSRVLLPFFPEPERAPGAPRPKPTLAASLKVSLSKFEIRALDAKGGLLALMPCSIAADKSKRPGGTLKVTTIIPKPNYTFAPDSPSQGRSKRVFPPGPNNPVGVSWIGLSLPGYGIHGTPKPESIGRAESHGCFRLANWNAVRLRQMVRSGIPVVIEK